MKQPEPWIIMWVVVFMIFFVCKWLTWKKALEDLGSGFGVRHALLTFKVL